MRVFLEIVIISLAAWVLVAAYRAISCARFSRALRAEAPSSQELGPIPVPRRSDLRGYPISESWEEAARSRRASQQERRSA
jgi:hypothetical protein